MTVKEAMKILTDEGFELYMQGSSVTGRVGLPENEHPDVKEAYRVCTFNGFIPAMPGKKYMERQKRLNDEEFKKRKKVPVSENPALKEAASQFNDALLDEQEKQIKKYKDQIKNLTGALHRKKIVIDHIRKESSKHLKDKIKTFYENQDLEQLVKDKEAVLADVAEELRLSKIREEKLTEICKKYLKEIEELRKKPHSNNRRNSTEAVAMYVDAVTAAELDGLFLDYWENDGNKITAIYQKKNGKQMKLCLDFTGEEIVFSRNTTGEKKHRTFAGAESRKPISFDESENSARENYFKRAKELWNNALKNRNNGNGIQDQMEVSVDLGKKEGDKTACVIIESKDDELDKILKRYLMTGVFVCPKGFSFSLKDFYKKLDEPVLACGLTQEDFFKKMKDIINSEL